MPRIGLTGGIGAGKSTVAELLREHGAVVIDADQIAREIVGPGTPALAEISATFGADVVLPDGTLDRPKLAALVFSDPDRLAALNRITHPRIATRSAELINAQPAETLVVYEMPLLLENGLTDGWDAVVVVDAPDEVRVTRLVTGRGMTSTDAERRMAAQLSRAERLAHADYVIDNSGEHDVTAAKVEQFIAWLASGSRS